jgi:hypothetical protein
LPSPLSYTLANDNPSLPTYPYSTCVAKFKGQAPIPKHGWTKWEAVQLADELEAEQEMMKADWECWKKIEERFERTHGPFLFDSDKDEQDKAGRDKRIRQRWNVDPLQHIKEMDMLLYPPSLTPTSWVSHTENSVQRNRRKMRRERAGKFINCTMGSGEKLIQKEAKNVCARPHSGIRLSVINKVDNNCMKGDDDNKRNKTNNDTANSNKEMSIGGSGFSVPSPGNNCKGRHYVDQLPIIFRQC